MFVGLYDTEYALIMAQKSVLSVLPVAIVF